jgi:hypothetical protein
MTFLHGVARMQNPGALVLLRVGAGGGLVRLAIGDVFAIDDVRGRVSRTSGGDAAAPIRDPVLQERN